VYNNLFLYASNICQWLLLYGLISLPLFDVSQVDFILESLCRLLSSYFYQLFICTFVRFHIKYICLPVHSVA